MRRIIIDVVPKSLRKLWSDWQLRVVVLISLILQIVLIVFGNRRKYIPRSWIRSVVWSAYLAADYVTTMALGVISSNLGDIYKDNGSIDANVELTAFWVPFLLFHLGGPDTITAYSLEDNELWSRQFLGLAVQTIGTVYTFLMAWTGSHLSILTILMIFAGLIKYGERIWALRSASSDQLRESMRSIASYPSDPSPANPNLVEEYNLRDAEGYNVIPNKVTEVQLPVDSFVFEDNSISEDHKLLAAYGLFQIFKRLFVDLILGSRDRDTSQTILSAATSENAFELIEMELSFMYDVLYTKAMLIYNPWGFALRIGSFTLTCVVLVFFSLASGKAGYSTVDLSITYLLLGIAVLLEIYATLVLLSSDWTIVWLNKNNHTSTLKVMASLPLFRFPFRFPRWSNCMAQYSLLSYTLKEKPIVCYGFWKRFSIIELLEQQRYTTYVEVPNILKEWIFNWLKEELKVMQQETLSVSRGNRALQKYGHDELNWSTEVEFDQSIFIWHIATEICCNLEDSTDGVQSKVDISLLLSKYMLYLLVTKPSMLPSGMSRFIFEDTCAEAVKFHSTEGKADVHGKLLQQYTTGTQLLGDRYRSKKSVLSDGCRLAQDLNNISNKQEKWSMMADFWVEILAYVANQSNGRQHAEQLTGGGEFLTHIWLLMAHFGLTGHFQIPQPRTVVKLNTR